MEVEHRRFRRIEDSPSRNHLQTKEKKGSQCFHIQLKQRKQMKQWIITIVNCCIQSFQSRVTEKRGQHLPFCPKCLNHSLPFIWTNLKSVKRMYWGQGWGGIRGSQIKPRVKQNKENCEWREQVGIPCPVKVYAKPAPERYFSWA